MSRTGTPVVAIPKDGQFVSCLSRTNICGYACCKFDLGNWIFVSQAEYDLAVKMGLSFDHLNIEDTDGGKKITCNRPCEPGEFKSIDCAIYGAFPANPEATKFIIHDTRKCPIPYNEMIEFIRGVQITLRDWEKDHPGSLEVMAKASKEFKAYQPFPYEIALEGYVRPLSFEEIMEINPLETLPDDYTPKYSDPKGYTGQHTPEDNSINTEQIVFDPIS